MRLLISDGRFEGWIFGACVDLGDYIWVFYGEFLVGVNECGGVDRLPVISSRKLI